MLRWWKDEGDVLTRDKEEGPKEFLARSLSDEGPLRDWQFRVSADASPGETICVTGDCYYLGQWNNERVFPLKKDDNSNIWSGMVKIPLQNDVEYRYCICILLEEDVNRQTKEHVIVRQWETSLYPRKIQRHDKVNAPELNETDTFGYYQHSERVERGWLTTETSVQIKLFNNPIEFWKQRLQNKPIYIKLTPVNLTKADAVQTVTPTMLDETLSLETMDLTENRVTWPIVEIAVMNEAEREFHPQDQFGRVIKENDFIIFQVLLHNPETVAYLVDFYTYGSKCGDNEPPCHIGFSYILPSVLRNSEGQTVAPITGVRHKPIGQLTVEYLVVKPIANVKCDMKTSMQREWKETWRGLDVGHRGAGSSFKGEIKQCADVRENTIASLKTAASHGADFVEFDVQLSKDLVPVLYHDFHVCISMKKKSNGRGDTDFLQIPVKDLTYEQLQLLKIYHLEEGKTRHSRFFDEDLEDHQPFPTLKQAMEVLDPTVGFNVEIKWTMQLKDGTYELYHPFDLNLYLDIMLEVVLNNAGSRNIVFSCFHPDICSMIRLKQNKYPVMFLTQGVTSKYPPYHDERCQSVPMAVHFAVGLGILGINVHSEDLLRDSSQVSLVKQAGLVLFCWGDDNNDLNTIKHLKNLGLHAIIYDKIDKYGSAEKKESIFRLEARESERMMIRAAAENAEREQNETDQSKTPEIEEPYFLNLDRARSLTAGGSTASCHSLLADSLCSTTNTEIFAVTQAPEQINTGAS